MSIDSRHATAAAPRALTPFSGRHYLTYPHARGFVRGGQSLILGQRAEDRYSLWLHTPETGESRILGSWPRGQCRGDMLWFDVAGERDEVFVVADNALWRLDLSTGSGEPVPPRLVYQEAPDTGATLVPLPSVSRDARRVVLIRRPRGGPAHQLVEIDTDSGRLRVLLQLDLPMNHAHFCPADEAWIGFCIEGAAEKHAGRIWGWHARLAPRGRCLFRQDDAGLKVGHERWARHAAVLFAVAYGESPGMPRGVYRISPYESRPLLVSEADRDWHLDISPDGRWLAVDTSGPHDAPGRGWDDAGLVSDILAIEAATGRRRFVARSRRSAGFHCHPHPVFGPDGRTIYFNEADPDGDGHRVVSAPNPWTADDNDPIFQL